MFIFLKLCSHFGKWNAVLLSIRTICVKYKLNWFLISILSFNQISSCAWPAASQLLCTLPGFHTCVRLFFVLIWKKWLLEKCLHTVFIVCPVCPEMRFESAPLTVSFGLPPPCPVERQEHVPAGSWWGNKGEIALGALSLHTLEWGLYLGPHGWHPQE